MSNKQERNSRYGIKLMEVQTLETSDGPMEVSMHECRPPFIRELDMVLPNVDLTRLLALPTMQRSRHDLVKIGDDIEQEKDRCLETFMSFAIAFRETLLSQDQTLFCDYIDPCSGLAIVTSNANKVFSEVDSAMQLLGYATQNCGCCKVLLHPKWSSAVYPATIFTTAPSDIILAPEFLPAVLQAMRPYVHP